MYCNISWNLLVVALDSVLEIMCVACVGACADRQAGGVVAGSGVHV